MADNSGHGGHEEPRPTYSETFLAGFYRTNPITCQALGVCSALAVTTKLENSLVMGAAVIFVNCLSNFLVSLLRKVIARRVRMMVEMAVIATGVILFDQFLKAFYWEMSGNLGPYVGLIITNCIIMGRAEAFAIQQPVGLSLVDGIANGLGYATVLALVGAVREFFGAGSLLGVRILGKGWYPDNLILVLAPGAFFAVGFIIWITNAFKQSRGGESSHE